MTTAPKHPNQCPGHTPMFPTCGGSFGNGNQSLLHPAWSAMEAGDCDAAFASYNSLGFRTCLKGRNPR